MKKLTSTTILILSVLCIRLANAQVTDITLLEDVEVKSYHLDMPLERSGRQVTVIPGSSFQGLPVSSIDDLLRYVPGIEVQQRQGFGVQGDFSMRGGTFTQTLVMIDGMRLNDPLTGHFNSNIPIAPSEIERIEVIKGASTAKFGADAAAGVIHIITKTFNQAPHEGQSIDGRLGMGEHNLLTVQTGLYLGSEKTAFSQGLLINRSSGQPLDSLAHNDFSITTASTSISHKLSENWRVSGRVAFDYRDFNARYFYTASTFDKSRETVQSWWGHTQLLGTVGKHLIETNLSHKWLSDDFVFNPAFTPNAHAVSLTNLMVQDALGLSRSIQLNIGGQLTHRSVRSNDRGNHEDWHQALFGAASVDFGAGIMVNGSLRADRDDSYDWEFSPQLDASWRLSTFTFRTSHGKSIRAADYTERYVSNNLPSPLSSGRNLGNPDLKAERAWSSEVGLDWRPMDHIKLSSTYFVRFSDGLIDYALTDASDIPDATNLSPTGSYLYTRNLSDLNHQGLEIEMNINRRVFEKHRIQSVVGLMWVGIQTDEEVTSKYLANAARFLGTCQVQWVAPKWQASITGVWKERQGASAESIGAYLSPQYTVWNAQVSYNATANISFFAQSLNVLDADYRDFLGATMPGRWMMGGVRWNWSQFKPRAVELEVGG